MVARAIKYNDLKKIKELNDKYYSDFEFPDFFRLLNGFVIEDDTGIIMAGGVEMVGEAVLVSNKERNAITLGRALVEAQAIDVFTCHKFGIRDLYAFVNNDDYAKHLIKHGFTDCPRALSMRILHGQKETA